MKYFQLIYKGPEYYSDGYPNPLLLFLWIRLRKPQINSLLKSILTVGRLQARSRRKRNQVALRFHGTKCVLIFILLFFRVMSESGDWVCGKMWARSRIDLSMDTHGSGSKRQCWTLTRYHLTFLNAFPSKWSLLYNIAIMKLICFTLVLACNLKAIFACLSKLASILIFFALASGLLISVKKMVPMSKKVNKLIWSASSDKRYKLF